MDLSFVTIGPIKGNAYGLLIGLAVVLAWEGLERIGAREGIEKKLITRSVVGSLVGGLIGARLYHVIDKWDYYFLHPGLMFQIWNGGLAIWGAIGGGILGLMVATRIWKRRADFLHVGDAAALMLPFSQAIGRVGNYLNQELYGKPTEWPIGIFIRPESRMPGYETATHFQPLFAYESGLLLLWGGWLWWLYRSKRLRFGQGGFLAFYFLGYGGIRLALEPLRIQPWEIGGIPTAMWFSVVVIAGAFWYLIKQRKKIWIDRKSY